MSSKKYVVYPKLNNKKLSKTFDDPKVALKWAKEGLDYGEEFVYYKGKKVSWEDAFIGNLVIIGKGEILNV